MSRAESENVNENELDATGAGKQQAKKKVKVLSSQNSNNPNAEHMPDIRGGVCEYCGLPFDKCEHYKGVDIFCSYCNRKDIIPFRKLKVWKMEDGSLLICCSDFSCRDKHFKKYNLNV